MLFVDAELGAHLASAHDSIAAEWVAMDVADVVEPFADRLAPEGAAPEPVEIQPDWTFNTIHSSGKTGAPKGIL